MKDSREEPKILGTLDLSTEELLYEDCTGRINFPNGIGECRCCVFSKEGTIPHFHLIGKDEFESCICIYEPYYFNHKINHCKLNSKQRKILNDWLDKPSYVNKLLTNWDAISFAWNIGNEGKFVPKDPKKPNYLNMENMKD